MEKVPVNPTNLSNNERRGKERRAGYRSPCRMGVKNHDAGCFEEHGKKEGRTKEEGQEKREEEIEMKRRKKYRAWWEQ